MCLYSWFNITSGTVSLFDGPAPHIRVFAQSGEEIEAVGDWVRAQVDRAFEPREVAVIVRSEQEMERAIAAINAAGVAHQILDHQMALEPDAVAIATMHLAKGLEFRALAVMACDEDVVPSANRLASAGDASDMEEIYNTERHLLYVACTRARDNLLVAAVTPSSEFLEDIVAT